MISWLDSSTYYTSFTEGWALYAENPLIARETNVYDNEPFQKYGMLKWQVRMLLYLFTYGLFFIIIIFLLFSAFLSALLFLSLAQMIYPLLYLFLRQSASSFIRGSQEPRFFLPSQMSIFWRVSPVRGNNKVGFVNIFVLAVQLLQLSFVFCFVSSSLC